MRGKSAVMVQSARFRIQLDFRMIALVRFNDRDVLHSDIFLQDDGMIEACIFAAMQPRFQIFPRDTKFIHNEPVGVFPVLHPLAVQHYVE